MPDLGIRLQLLLGPTVPVPAPYAVIDALREVEVTNRDQERDGFQLRFSLGKESPLDYGLLLSSVLDPPARVIIQVFIGTLPQILIDGIITDQQFTPGVRPGESTLVVTGEDISLKLDLEEKSTTHPNQPDSTVVSKLLGNYATLGLVPKVTSTEDTPSQADRIPTQQGTDLTYIRELARRNGFVFYIEPLATPGTNLAYWGLDNRLGQPQPALTMNMGSDTNVDTPINFRYNALGPAQPQVTIVDPNSKVAIPVPLPSSLRPPLAARPAAALRKVIPRNTANLSQAQAALRGLAASTAASDAVTASGQVSASRYGRALQSRRLVGVRGVGASYGGNYYVKEVTHRIKRGEYTQSFTLTREGLGALTPMVVP